MRTSLCQFVFHIVLHTYISLAVSSDERFDPSAGTQTSTTGERNQEPSRRLRDVGRRLWNTLQLQQEALIRYPESEDLPRWQSLNLQPSFLSYDLCYNQGPVRLFLPEACHATFDQTAHYFRQRESAPATMRFQLAMNTEYDMVVTDRLNSTGNPIRVLSGWSSLLMRRWVELCAHHQPQPKPVSSLKVIVFRVASYHQSTIFEVILQGNRSLVIPAEVGSDTFFALIATQWSVGIVNLLSWFAYYLATRNAEGTITAVKSVQRIRVVRKPSEPHDAYFLYYELTDVPRRHQPMEPFIPGVPGLGERILTDNTWFLGAGREQGLHTSTDMLSSERTASSSGDRGNIQSGDGISIHGKEDSGTTEIGAERDTQDREEVNRSMRSLPRPRTRSQGDASDSHTTNTNLDVATAISISIKTATSMASNNRETLATWSPTGPQDTLMTAGSATQRGRSIWNQLCKCFIPQAS